MIINPHLPGESFFWQAGPIGVLLVHGFTATTSEIQPLASALHKEGYTLSGPLLPGHFTSPDILNQTKWQDWVNSVEKSYRILSEKCEQVIVGGESAGGLLSLYLAAFHPEIKGLLLYAPALKFKYSAFDLFRLNLIAPIVPWIKKHNPDENPLWQGYRVYPLKGGQQVLALQKKVKLLLPSINQPVLIVQGRQDPTIHPDVPDLIVSSVGSKIKEIHWMENSKHCVAIDCEMDQVIRITIKFLQRGLTA